VAKHPPEAITSTTATKKHPLEQNGGKASASEHKPTTKATRTM